MGILKRLLGLGLLFTGSIARAQHVAPRQILTTTTVTNTNIASTATKLVTTTAAGSAPTLYNGGPSPSNSSGPTSSPLLFFVLLALGCLLLLILLAFAIYYYRTHRTRSNLAPFPNAPPLPGSNNYIPPPGGPPGHELQPPLNPEIHGYYSPPAPVRPREEAPGISPQQEVYGFFAPEAKRRTGDFVGVRPVAGTGTGMGS